MPENIQNQIELARDICRYAHSGQTDKACRPYHTHPEQVAEFVKEHKAKIAALLHDVLEDTEFPVSVLAALFGSEIMNALELLNHDKSVPYLEYVERLSSNEIAKEVKAADLRHNMDLSRIPDPTEKDFKRLEMYKKALTILEDAE